MSQQMQSLNNSENYDRSWNLWLDPPLALLCNRPTNLFSTHSNLYEYRSQPSRKKLTSRSWPLFARTSMPFTAAS
eukprot:765975-Pyramimonas_sp.AAC.1